MNPHTFPLWILLEALSLSYARFSKQSVEGKEKDYLGEDHMREQGRGVLLITNRV